MTVPGGYPGTGDDGRRQPPPGAGGYGPGGYGGHTPGGFPWPQPPDHQGPPPGHRVPRWPAAPAGPGGHGGPGEPPGPPVPGPPPRRRRLRSMSAWIGVVAAGVVSTVVATVVVNALGQGDGKDDQAGPSTSSSASVPAAPAATGTRPAVRGDDMTTWPDVCDLLTDDEIRAVMPTLVSVYRGGYRGAAEVDGRNVGTPKNTECKYNLNLGGATGEPRITISLLYVGKDETDTREYLAGLRTRAGNDPEFRPLGPGQGADDAFRVRGLHTIRKGVVILNLSVFAPFTNSDGSPLRDQEGWGNDAVLRLTPLVAAKLG